MCLILFDSVILATPVALTSPDGISFSFRVLLQGSQLHCLTVLGPEQITLEVYQETLPLLHYQAFRLLLFKLYSVFLPIPILRR